MAGVVRRQSGSTDESWNATADPMEKVKMALRLRRESIMTLKWIAERLQMGAPGYVNLLLYRQRKAI